MIIYLMNFNAIKIQNIFRSFSSTKIIKDNFTPNKLKNYINIYINLYNDIENLDIKKIRRPNYPSEITENITKFAIQKHYNIIPSWDTRKGDLYLNNKNFEVKGSIDLLNGGPCSFGPTEQWNRIYFVDAKYHKLKKFTVYEIMLSNKSDIWKNIKVNKNETFQDQCDQKRRPRIKFNNLINQISYKYIKIIFDGNIDDLI